MWVLISGASVAGPVLAYWLTRYGFTPTVVEKAPRLRKTGGHAVDLFRPAMDIVERMGLLEQVQAKKTGTERLTLSRDGISRPVHVEMSRLMTAVSDRHVEIMRDDLAEIFYDATRDEVDYVFGDSITSIPQSGAVTFDQGGDCCIEGGRRSACSSACAASAVFIRSARHDRRSPASGSHGR
jgi:2-polyprenyl-6-methoxyphenol hydroxylase-like FAD-dependent oxidoreductase